MSSIFNWLSKNTQAAETTPWNKKKSIESNNDNGRYDNSVLNSDQVNTTEGILRLPVWSINNHEK